MKKIFQEQKWIDRSKKKSARALKKKRKERASDRAVNLEIHQYHENQSAKRRRTYIPNTRTRRKQVTLTVPTIFSLMRNTDETLFFFEMFKSNLQHKETIYLDFSSVTHISPDALLYILSLMDYYQNYYGYFDVGGNIPKDEKARKFVFDSGFLDYMQEKPEVYERRTPKRTLAIEHGEKVLGVLAKKVQDFVKQFVPGKEITRYKSIFTILIECMSNTRSHAFSIGKYEKYDRKRWWMMCHYEDDNDSVHFTFLDDGGSIPITLRKRHKEKAKTIINSLKASLGFEHSTFDSKLIESALAGEFRTRTGEHFRGKGLPKIKKCNDSRDITDLKIISNRGFVDCDNNISKELSAKFKGTLLTWTFANGG